MTHPSIVADALDAAADLLSKPGGWTQGGYARDATAEVVCANDPSAICWCALGAIRRVTPLSDNLIYCGAVEALAAFVDDIADWNDDPDRTQDEVTTALREAAAKARGEVQP